MDISLSNVLNLSMETLNCSLNVADEAAGSEEVDEAGGCSAVGEASCMNTSSESLVGSVMSRAGAVDAGMGKALEEVTVVSGTLLVCPWVDDKFGTNASFAVLKDCAEFEELVPLAEPLLARLFLSPLVSVEELELACVLLPLATDDGSTGLSRSKPNWSKERLKDVVLPGRDI